MIKRILVQNIKWHDLDNKIFDETPTCNWLLFGVIPLRRRVITVRHTLPTEEDRGMGFKTES